MSAERLTRWALRAVFFGLFTPLAQILRGLGVDLIQRQLNRSTPSYWRQPRGRRRSGDARASQAAEPPQRQR
jgi:hypothetical protein